MIVFMYIRQREPAKIVSTEWKLTIVFLRGLNVVSPEGNTRTVITFATQFAEYHGFKMNKSLLKENSAYVRDSLVKASDGMYSEYQYLTRIIKDAIING